MKKKISIFGICIITMLGLLLTSCGIDMSYGDLDLEKHIKVGKYKGLETEKIKVKVSKKDIGDWIVKDLEAAGKDVKVAKGDTVLNKDTVNIDYVGKIDGKKFEGGSAKAQSLKIGSGTFIEGFESGLEGHKVGEKGIELNLAFPLDYPKKELQGKDVVFEVKINSATRKQNPEYNDKFVQSLGNYQTTADYEKAIEDLLYQQKKKEAENEQVIKLWDKVLSDTKVKKYPEEMVEHYIETFDAYVDYEAERNNTDRTTIMAQAYGVESEELLQKQFKESAELLVKQEMLIIYIAKAENLSYKEKDKEKMRKDIEAQGYDDKTVKIVTGRSMEEYLDMQELFKEVQNFLLKNAKEK